MYELHHSRVRWPQWSASNSLIPLLQMQEQDAGGQAKGLVLLPSPFAFGSRTTTSVDCTGRISGSLDYGERIYYSREILSTRLSFILLFRQLLRTKNLKECTICRSSDVRHRCEAEEVIWSIHARQRVRQPHLRDVFLTLNSCVRTAGTTDAWSCPIAASQLPENWGTDKTSFQPHRPWQEQCPWRVCALRSVRLCADSYRFSKLRLCWRTTSDVAGAPNPSRSKAQSQDQKGGVAPVAQDGAADAGVDIPGLDRV